MSQTKVKPVMEVKKCKAGQVGTCTFCTDNIGPNGTINPNETVYEITGNHSSVRFCKECFGRAQQAVWMLSKN